MEIWVNLVTDPDSEGNNWYAGSATSVLLDGKEELDPFTAEIPWLYMFHDREKRCMQVDQIQLWDKREGKPVGSPAKLYGRPYELISQYTTAGGASIVIASDPFEEDYWEAHGTTPFRLYRTIQIYSNADIVDEELSVRAFGRPDLETARPYFTVQFFSYIAFHSRPTLIWDTNEPNFYAIGCFDGERPHPGYGFASDVNIMDVEHPAHRFPHEQNKVNAFSWKLAPSDSVKCRHLFTRYDNHRVVKNRIEECWKTI